MNRYLSQKWTLQVGIRHRRARACANEISTSTGMISKKRLLSSLHYSYSPTNQEDEEDKVIRLRNASSFLRQKSDSNYYSIKRGIRVDDAPSRISSNHRSFSTHSTSSSSSWVNGGQNEQTQQQQQQETYGTYSTLNNSPSEQSTFGFDKPLSEGETPGTAAALAAALGMDPPPPPPSATTGGGGDFTVSNFDAVAAATAPLSSDTVLASTEGEQEAASLSQSIAPPPSPSLHQQQLHSAQNQLQKSPQNQMIEEILTSPPGTLGAEQIKFTCSTIKRLCQPRQDDTVAAGAAVARAEILLQRLVQEAQLDSPEAWNYVIGGYARLPVEHYDNTDEDDDASGEASSSPSSSGQRYPFKNAYGLLRQMLRLHQQHPHLHPAPDNYSYTTVLYACSKYSAVADDAVVIAESLIRSVEHPNSILSPTVEMYNNVIMAHANRAATVYGAATAAEDWLMHVSKQASAGLTDQPDTGTFNRVLSAWSHSPEESGAQRCAEILHLMLDLAGSVENSRVQPDTISFSTVISAFAKRQRPDKCIEILRQAIKYFSETAAPDSVVDLTQCWNAVIFAYAKSGTPDAADRVQHLLRDAEDLQNATKKIFVQPDTATQAAYIEAVLKSSQPNRVEKAEQQLSLMVEKYKKSPATRNTAAPTTKEFEAVINAWYRVQPEYEGDGINKYYGQGARHMFGYSANHASDLLFAMNNLTNQISPRMQCAPTTGTYNMCIDLWGKTSKAALHVARNAGSGAVALRSKANITDKQKTSIVAMEKRQKLMIEQSLFAARNASKLLAMAEAQKLSNHFSYSSMINCLCRHETDETTFEAVKVLRRLEKETDERGLEWNDKATGLYTLVVTALSKVGSLEAAELALQILKNMPKTGRRAVHGTWRLYTGVIVAFSKTPRNDRSGKAAYEVFEMMKALHEDPNEKVFLDTVVFERLLWTLASQNVDKLSADRACQVLAYMLHLHAQGGNKDVVPTANSFNAVFDALIRMQDETYLKRAVLLLKTIVQKYEEKALPHLPSENTFHKLIKACMAGKSAALVQNGYEIKAIGQRIATSRSEKK